MKLLTKEIEIRLRKFPLDSQGEKGMDSEVIVKFFNPYGRGVWLITEAEPMKNGDWLLFGFCHVYCWEWGSVYLSTLEKIKVNVFGYERSLERDRFIGDHPTVAELVEKTRVI